MIQLTQLGGDAFVLNAELIRYVESRPDTIITLTNNERLVVREPMAEVLARAVDYQRSKHLWKGLESRIENQASRIENRESSIENREPRTQSLV